MLNKVVRLLEYLFLAEAALQVAFVLLLQVSWHWSCYTMLGRMRLDGVKLPQIAADWQFIPSLAQQCQTHYMSGRQRIQLD